MDWSELQRRTTETLVAEGCDEKIAAWAADQAISAWFDNHADPDKSEEDAVLADARKAVELAAHSHDGLNGGYYLMCPCDDCSGKRAEAQARHEANCKRKDGSACSFHQDTRCHCDCGRR